MRIPLGQGSGLRIEFNRLMWAGVAVAGLGVAGWIASFLGAFPRDSGSLRLPFADLRVQHSDLPLGLTILGAALYAVGRIVQMVGQIRSRR